MQQQSSMCLCYTPATTKQKTTTTRRKTTRTETTTTTTTINRIRSTSSRSTSILHHTIIPSNFRPVVAVVLVASTVITILLLLLLSSSSTSTTTRTTKRIMMMMKMLVRCTNRRLQQYNQQRIPFYTITTTTTATNLVHSFSLLRSSNPSLLVSRRRRRRQRRSNSNNNHFVSYYTTTLSSKWSSNNNKNKENYGYYNNFNLNDGFSYSKSSNIIPTTTTSLFESSIQQQDHDNDNDNDDDNTFSIHAYDPYDDYDPKAAALNLQYEQDNNNNNYDDMYDATAFQQQQQQQQQAIYDSDDSYAAADDDKSGFMVNHQEEQPLINYVDEQSPILFNLNSNQIDAVTKPIHSITRVIAGPGSGKTRVLTNRIVYLLQQQQQLTSSSSYPPQILAVTFTRKASNEMQERLYKLLYDQEQYIASKVQQQGPPEQQQQQQQQRRRTNIDEAYGDVGSHNNDINNEQYRNSHPSIDECMRRVTLGTFHSVCTKILRWNGEYLSSLPSIQADLSKSETTSYGNVLNSNFNIIEDREQTRILKETLEEYNINLEKYKNIKLDNIMKEINACKAKLYNGNNPFDGGPQKKGDPPKSPLKEIVQKIYYRYREKVLLSNRLDFDDLLYLTRELLELHKDVRARYQKKWAHIFVDEYQDTSEVQVELIKLLTTSSLFVVGDADQSIYAWRGAYAESLYDFEDVFQSFSNKNGGAVQTVYLMENYRSTSKIVQAAQKVISHSKSETGANKLRREMIPRGLDGTAPRILSFTNGEKEAEYLVNRIQQQLASGEYGPNHTLAFIYRTNAQSRVMEEALVLFNIPYVIFGSSTSFYNRQEIRDCLCYLRWLNNGRDRMAMLRAVETPKRGLGDSAVREFDDYCILVEQLWEEKHPGVDKPNALEILFHLSGEHSWCTVPNPQFPPPEETLSSRPRKLWTEFSNEMINIWNIAKKRTVSQTLQEVLDQFNLRQHFDKISKSKDECAERLANVDELIKASLRYDNDGACLMTNKPAITDGDQEMLSPLGVFLDDILMITESAKTSADRVGEERFVASLMTIHASKGMEFDTVYFVGVEDGTIPSAQSLQLGEGSIPYEEEKRLCYVAMTRAKSELVMSWRQSVTIFTADGLKSIDRPRSRFLDVLVSKKPEDKKPTISTIPKKIHSSDRYVSVKERANQIKNWSSSSKVRQIGTVSTPTASKFTGTASVYGSKKQQVSIEKQVKTPSKNIAAPRTPLASPKMQSTINGVASHAQSRGGHTDHPNRAMIDSRSLSSTKAKEQSPTVSTSKSSTNKVDSSWFFPIGSKVRHRRLGDGIVLPPNGESSMTVLVKFHTGERQEFPVQTTDISPILT